MANYTLYLLRCADDSLYTGIAADLDRRLAEHSSGLRGAKYLRGRGPLTLVFSENVGDRSTALSLEVKVKRLSRATKLRLVHDGLGLADVLPGYTPVEGPSE